MNSPYESIIGIRSHGGVALREAPDITGSLHEIMLGMGRDLEEIHIGDCGIHQGAEKNNPRILSPSLLRARSL